MIPILYSPTDQFPSADMNKIQRRAVGIYQASGQFFGQRPVLASTGGTNLTISAHGGVALDTTADTAVIILGTGVTLTLAGLGNNEWRYVYAYNNATYPSTSIDYEHSTTAPSSDLTQKGSDSTRTYIGCFRTDGSGNVIPFRSTRYGVYVYRWSKLAGTRTDLQVGSTLSTAGWNDVILRNASAVSVIPPHARIARLRAEINGAIGTFAKLRTKGDTSDYHDLPALLATPGMTHFDLEMETDSSLTIQYNIGTATDIRNLYVTGWSE